MSVRLINLNHAMNACFGQGITSIIGPNGCGKSTFLKIISGLSAPAIGQVWIQGKNLYQNLEKIKLLIGYVAPSSFLYPHLTVLENLHFIAKLKKTFTPIEASQVQNILYLCQLEKYQHVCFSKLSDGFKKKVCIASQLLHDPTYLFLDEPCTGLDPTQRQNLWNLFKNLRNNGKYIIFSSHHVQEILAFCDACYILSRTDLLLMESTIMDEKSNAIYHSSPGAI